MENDATKYRKEFWVQGGLRTFFVRFRNALVRQVDAVPLDIFRVLMGVLLLSYFIRTFLEAGDFSGPDSLIDHRLSLDIFWFTNTGIFQPGMSLFMFQAIYLFACICCISLILGYRVKVSTAILYVIAVCTYRWNFLVMYVDDAIIHLMIFWLLLLPVGRTLVLSEWIKDRKVAWARWKNVTVSGTALRCFFWNLALIYIVAGLWKWTSPMWRDGTALYTILKLPISYAPDFWGMEHLFALKIFNYVALILEPIFPLLIILPKGHYTKYLLLLGLFAFHLGTIATLDIPFANIACLVAAILIFRGELMDWIRGQRAETRLSESTAQIGFSGAIALFMVTMLTLAMLSSISLPRWRNPARENITTRSETVFAENGTSENPDQSGEFEESGHEGLDSVQTIFFGSLWCIGIAQQYQLFNWIDERNYSVNYKIIEYENERPVGEINPDEMFLHSTRGVLLQFYLHDITWVRVPPKRREELRQNLLKRFTDRFCRNSKSEGRIAVYSTLERISPSNNQSRENPELLMSFSCRDGDR